jgi:formylglycine-generating enzyme required for sulfatase activity
LYPFCLFLFSHYIGCGISDKNPSNNLSSAINSVPAGNASVKFKMVTPPSVDGSVNAAIRGSTSTTVTFKVFVGNPGDSQNPKSVLIKTVPITGDTASVTFSGLPARPVVAQVHIVNGNYQGYYDFHGALDLTESSTNIIEVAPAGSRMPQDVVAHAALSAFNSPELMATANAALISSLNTQIKTLDLSSPNVYSEAINKVIEIQRPSTQTYFNISADKKSLLGYANSAQVWTKATTSLFDSADIWGKTVADMSIKSILRQSVGDKGYVAWKHDTLSAFVIAVIKTDGTKAAFVKNPGLCEQMIVLDDGSVVVGGINEDKGEPVLFKWSATADGATYSNSGAEENLAWFKYFSGHNANATVKSIQFDGDKTFFVTIDNPVKVYRVSTDGVVENPTPASPNVFPVVSMTAPIADSVHQEGDAVTISASATDPDGSIAKVSFYNGQTLLGEDTSSPYSIAKSSLDIGDYRVRAIATDDKGAMSVSLPVVFKVSGPVIASTTYASAIMRNGENTVMWLPVTDAVSYNIYYGTSAGITKSNSTKITGVTSPYIHQNLTNGTAYYYVVTAVDANSESEVSMEVNATPLAPSAGTTEVELGDGVSMDFVLINNGSFVMGQADGSDDEKPTRTVTLTKSFYMGKYEVTQEQYQKLMGESPSYYTPANSYSDTSNHPVEKVNWVDAVRFCNALSVSQNRTPCYTKNCNPDIPKATNSFSGYIDCDWSANGYRLPTEAEWEYSARAGTNTNYTWGNAEDEATLKANSWCAYNADSENWTDPHAVEDGTQSVGQKPANAWELHDMLGNVAEWCWDGYDANYYADENNTVDPTGGYPTSLYRVYRGGSFGSSAPYLRIADRPLRSSTQILSVNRGKGFRILRPIQN